jgi:CubicO group peptidase (beta-lactamase class C family)
MNYLKNAQRETYSPGLSVAIAHKGKIIFSGAVGTSDMSNNVPKTGKTVNNIGSISKIFAAIAIMQLEAEGKVDLDKPIQTYLPYFPEKKHPVTIRQIMTHTSGIRHYIGSDRDPCNTARHYNTFKESVEFWKNDSLVYQPGKFWMYSSFATNLLQGVIEAVSGHDYENYLMAKIWKPVKMQDTYLDVPTKIIKNRGKGYSWDFRTMSMINARYEDPSYKYVGGGIISSVEDLVRLGSALNKGELLKKESIQKMYKPQLKEDITVFNRSKKIKDFEKVSREQALIWYWQKDNLGNKWVGHGGSVKGTKSMLMNYPEKDLVIAFHANFSGVNPGKHAKDIAEMVVPLLEKK